MNRIKHSVFYIFSTFPIKHRLLITYLFLSGFILVITAVAFYNTAKNALVEHATLSSQQQLTIITNNLSEKIGHISDYAITLSINSDIGETLKENPTVPENALSRFFVNSTLTKQAQRIIGLHKNISNWDILDTENNWYHSSTDITEELTPCLSPEFLQVLQTDPSFHFLGPYTIDGTPTFAALKPVTDIDTTKYLGTVALLIQEPSISSAFRDLPDSDLRNFYITDSDNRILSSSTSEGIYESFASYTGISTKEMKKLEDTNMATAYIHGTETLLIRKEYPGLDWYVVNLIPLQNLTMEHRTVLQTIVLICVLLFILSLFFSMLCTRTVTAPIQRLASKMETASVGNLDISASYHSNDELAVLYKQFNLMMQRIQTLIDHVYEEQSAKQEMEIRLLQSQINPHFLYNTLSTIKSLIELEMNETAVKAVAAMSVFYRNSLSKGRFIIPLKQELELTEQYLYIQSLRYMEYVDYEFNLTATFPMDQIDIPKLTLQPIVENIFVHALSTEKCHICVNITEDDANVAITITDNGTGIPPEKLKELQTSIYSGSVDGRSFGLPNIHHRIILLYGMNYGLTITSREKEFTAVTVTLPKGGAKDEDPDNC